MRDEIAAGLKNALERGYTLKQAMQTFLNAGYNPQEVMAAGKMLTVGATDILNPEQPQSIVEPNKNAAKPAQEERKDITNPMKTSNKPLQETGKNVIGAQTNPQEKNRVAPLPKNETQMKKENKRKRILVIVGVVIALGIFLGLLIFLIYSLLKG